MITKQNRTRFIILIVSFLMISLVAFSLCAGASVFARAEVISLVGEGTKESPKLISTADEFLFFVNSANSADADVKTAYLNYHYRLDYDIDLSSALLATSLTPIGSATAPFNGTFNGNGRIIKGVKVTSSQENVGLFGYLGANAEINRLGIVDGSVSAPLKNNVGGIVGYNNGKITECFFSGSVNGANSVGGIAGYNAGRIDYSFTNGTVSAPKNLGGLVGVNAGPLTYSYTIAKVSGNGEYVGAVVGNRASESSGTPSYNFYNASLNANLSGIGNGIGEEAITLPDNKIKALSRIAFNTMDVISLFDSAYARFDRPFTVEDHSLYAVPVQKVFASRYASADVMFKKNLMNASVERMYGINQSSDAEWGSFENPYLISNETHLRNLQKAVTEQKEDYRGKTFRQSTNITLSSSVFYPIGNYEKNTVFQGEYDGDNKIISNLDVLETATDNKYLGMFGYIGQYSTLKNIVLDAECSVQGIENIGSLVGYNAGGRIQNVISEATVSGSKNVGGLVGVTNKGNYEDILSKVTLLLRGSISGGLYGIIGSYVDAVPETLDNVWYFTSLDNAFISTNQLGSVMLLDGTGGCTIEAQKDDVGNITFNEVYAKPGFTVEYRKSDESPVCQEDTYSPTQSTYSNATVYARFVKQISVSTNNETYSSVSFRNDMERFYVGQTFNVAIAIKDGAFVKEIVGSFDSTSYDYESNTQSVIFSAKMNADTENVSVNIATISWDPEMFKENYTYNGKSVEFPKETHQMNEINANNMPEDYTIFVNYGGGSAPVEANLTNLDNYTLTVIYQNKDGMRMGAKNAYFHISRAPLSIAKEYLSNTKEWDDSTAAVKAEVDQSGVQGVIEGDDVIVEATMRFNTKEVTEAIKANVTYEFSLSGSSARNYSAPVTETYLAFGTITKRQIRISFDSYEGAFTGLDVAPSLGGKNITSKGNVAGKPYEPVYTFSKIGGGTMGSVGEYELRVALSNTIYPDAQKTYEISFEDAIESVVDGEVQYTYKIYTVLPLQVDVEYFIDGVKGTEITYDGLSHNVTAQYKDVYGTIIPLNLQIEKNEETVTILQNADTYKVRVVDFNDANYDLGISANKDVIVNKAVQEPLTFTSSNTHIFGSTYTATVSGGSGEGVISFSTVDDAEDKGTFSGAELTLIKAGTIGIKAVKAESENYLEQSITMDLVVSKADLTVLVKSFTIDYLTVPTFVLESSDGLIPSGVEGVKYFIDDVLYEGEILNVGSYTLDMDITEAVSDGYNLIKGEATTLTVNRLNVDVTAHQKTSVYGDALSELTYTVSDDRVENLVGELQVDALNVGEYDILCGTLNNENNANFNINFISAKYTVTEKELKVVLDSAQKEYGDVDPAITFTVEGLALEDSIESIGLQVNVNRESGEESFLEGIGIAKVYNYLVNSITHVSDNYKDVVLYEGASLTIVPKAVTVSDVQGISISAGTLLSENGAPNATFSGMIYNNATYSWEREALSGTASWVIDEIPSFRENATLTYKARFIPENQNFRTTEFDVQVSVIPKGITLKFTSQRQITYDGYEHNTATYEFVGLIAGEEALETVEYLGDYKNAGTFKVKITLGNANYKLLGTGEMNVEIVKAPLTISADDVSVVEGEEYSINYIYSGFADKDNVDVLTKEPSVTSLPTKIGTYKLKASGAVAENYVITYAEFTVKILTTTLKEVENENITISGEFDVDTKFSCEESESTDDIADIFYGVQSSYKALEGMWVEKVYDLTYTLNDSPLTLEGKVYITMPLLEGYENVKVAYAVLNNNNEIVYIQDVVVDGNVVTVNVTNAKALLILAEREVDIMQYAVYVGIGVVALIVIVIIISVARSAKKRREARYVKYDEE